MHGINLTIPDGWRRLACTDAVQAGDMWMSESNPIPKPCNYSIGKDLLSSSFYLDNFVFIRKYSPPPDQDWLNPWD